LYKGKKMAEVSASYQGNYGVYSTASRQLSQLQTDLQTAQQQVSSGLVSNYYDEDANNARQSLNIKVERRDLVQISDNIKVITDRTDRATTSINTLLDITEQFQTRLTGVINGGQAKDIGFQKDCQNWLKQAQDALNVRDVNGNAIFGGTEFTKDPFDASLAPVPDLVSVVSTAPYQGTTDTITARIGTNTTQEVSQNGSHDAFLQIFYFLKIGANYAPDGVSDSTNMQMLRKGLSSAQEATKGLTEQLQTVKSLSSLLISNQNVIDDQKTLLEGTQKELDGVDLLDKYTLMLQLQQQNLFTYSVSMKNSELNQQILNLSI
jgi:hypothetical protein